MEWYALLTTIFVILYVAVRLSDKSDVPKIQNLPSIPEVPVFGNLLQLGEEHAKNAAKWAKKLGPVFQVRLGNRRFIFANTFDSVKHFWITNQSALISRPTMHTFHSVLSSSQGFTIGTSPWDESCKRRRKAAATALNRPAVQSYMPFLDLESCASLKELYQDACCKNGEIDINPYLYFQRFALNLSLTLCYGFRIDDGIENKLFHEIITVERSVSTLRSTSNNWQDYIPLLRFFSRRSNEATNIRNRRDAYLDFLIKRLHDKIESGTDKPCITGNVIKDPDAKLNEDEVKSICMTMISGGLDTTPACILLGIAYLSSHHGQEIQEHAYEEITRAYPDGDAWHKCISEEKVEYMSALIKEILRFWTVVPMALPRVSIKDIKWQDATIPAGTTFVMNAWAADYDPDHFQEPQKFIPERYLDIDAGSGTAHYAYGAGSRMCAGSHLANRELYVTFTRLILAFEISSASNREDWPILDAMACNSNKTGLTTEPKDFKVSFRVRDKAKLDEWIRVSEEKTTELREP